MQLTLEVESQLLRCTVEIRKFVEEILVENQKLRIENEELRARLNQNSNNSSKPPASNPFNKIKSLRGKTGRKPGGQPGHKGSTLRTVEDPDVVVEHQVNTCDHCGADVSPSPPIGCKTRQVVDVHITKVVTEHRSEIKDCPACKGQTTAAFPPGVDHYIQYGDVFSAIVVCLNKGNYIPYDRLSKISKDIFGIPVSSGTLVNIVHDCGEALEKPMKHIKDQLKKSNVAHFDETGTRVKGKTQWLHTAGNENYTYMETHTKRGSVAANEIGILSEFAGTAVHDFWKPYFNFVRCSHALCNAHILRELNGITENFQQSWSEKMKSLLVEIKKTVDAAGGALNLAQVAIFQARYDAILSLGDQENPIDVSAMAKNKVRGRTARSKARNLLDRMKLYKQDILKFMTDPAVPFDNNLAERDIRMSKLQQKVSGGFRSDTGNRVFDKIHSYISTATKQRISMFESIRAAISGQPLFTGDKH